MQGKGPALLLQPSFLFIFQRRGILSRDGDIGVTPSSLWAPPPVSAGNLLLLISRALSDILSSLSAPRQYWAVPAFMMWLEGPAGGDSRSLQMDVEKPSWRPGVPESSLVGGASEDTEILLLILHWTGDPGVLGRRGPQHSDAGIPMSGWGPRRRGEEERAVSAASQEMSVAGIRSS